MITWIILGLITSLLAVKLLPRTSSVLGTLILGVLGATLGGFIGTLLFSADQTPGFNLPVILVVGCGSILLLGLQRSILRN